MLMDNAFTSITIPVELAEKIKKRISGTGFTSLSSYVAFVLREIIGQGEFNKEKEPKDMLTSGEKSELLKRLKNLGYI
jgi:hypothetical protein